MELALLTAVIATVIFYLILRILYKKQPNQKIEIKIMERAINKKLPIKIREKILRLAILYYSLLFFVANFVAFYTEKILLLTIYSLIIFMVGLLLGYKILIWYSKKITIK